MLLQNTLIVSTRVAFFFLFPLFALVVFILSPLHGLHGPI